MDAQPATDTVAARLLQLAADAGVTAVYGLPGVHNLAFWDVDGGPRIVNVRHEQTAVAAADGWARVSGRPGIALTTSGPGAANALAAFGEAATSGSPVLLVASDVAVGLRAPGRVRGLLHESADQSAFFATLAKSVATPTTPEDAVEAFEQALETAMTWPRGPAYVGVPSDVLTMAAPAARPLRHLVRPAPDPQIVDEAARLVAQVDRVVMLVGGGAVQSGAAEHVDALARRLGSPVITTFAARGLLGADHPLLVDVPPHEPVVDELLKEAELVLAIGTALDGMTTRNWTMELPSRLVRIDVSEAESDDDYPADVHITADAAVACDALALRVGGREPWADAPHRMRRDLRRAHAASRETRPAAQLLDAIEQGWPDDGVVVCDMAIAGYWVGGYAAQCRPRRLLYPVGWGTLGFALPASIGAARGGRPTLVVCGDGGLAMAIGEVATLRQEGLPVCVLVVDDEGYGMLRYDQDRAGSPRRGVDLDGPDWAALGDAHGIDADVVDLHELETALVRAAALKAPSLLWLQATLTPPRTTSPRWRDPA